MRKEASNTFSDGLNMDLNPNNTPNTVLTDNVNGTIITYNGNEFLLQNDQGNYKLENCKLKENYIPVGVKEYADTLYIVSYNPLDKHVEIGSYPAPKTIQSSARSGEGLSLNPIISGSGGKYMDLVKGNKYILFYNGDNRDDDDYKLYPGDQYKIDATNDSIWKYEGLEYIIIDENQKKWDITDEVIPDGEYHYVSWQIPGWLGAQYRLATFEEFDVSAKYVYKPTFKTDESFKFETRLNFQFKVSDKLILNGNKSDIGVDVVIKNNGEIIAENQYTIQEDAIDWYTNTKVFYINELITKDGDIVNNDSIIEITATPYISSGGVKVIYDNFEQNLSFSMSAIGDLNDVSVGNNLYQWYVNKPDDNYYGDSIFINLGIVGPEIIANDVCLAYKIKDINGNIIRDWTKTENVWSTGSVGSTIPFDDKFKQEDVYLIQFGFAQEGVEMDDKTVQTKDEWDKPLITSIVFNKFIEEGKQLFDKEILFNEWSSEFKNYIKFDSSFNITNKGANKVIYESADGNVELYNRLIRKDIKENASLLFSEDIPEEFTVKKGWTIPVTGDYSEKYDGLNGKLWDGLVDSFIYERHINSDSDTSLLQIGNNQKVNVNIFKSLKIDSFIPASERLTFGKNIQFKNLLKKETPLTVPMVTVQVWRSGAKTVSIQTRKGYNGTILDKIEGKSIVGQIATGMAFALPVILLPEAAAVWVGTAALLVNNQKPTIIAKNETTKYLAELSGGRLCPLVVAMVDDSRGASDTQNKAVALSPDNKYDADLSYVSSAGTTFVLLLTIQCTTGVYIIDPKCDSQSIRNRYDIDEKFAYTEFTDEGYSEEGESIPSYSGKDEEDLRLNDENFNNWLSSALNSLNQLYGDLYFNQVLDKLSDGCIYIPNITNAISSWNKPEIDADIDLHLDSWKYDSYNLLNETNRIKTNGALFAGKNPDNLINVKNNFPVDLETTIDGNWPISNSGDHIGFEQLITNFRELNDIKYETLSRDAKMIEYIVDKNGSTIGVSYASPQDSNGVNKINSFARTHGIIAVDTGGHELNAVVCERSGKTQKNLRSIAIGDIDLYQDDSTGKSKLKGFAFNDLNDEN